MVILPGHNYPDNRPGITISLCFVTFEFQEKEELVSF